MSVQAIAAAFETNLVGIDRLVLIALANHCHKMTDTLFPSVGLLAWEAGVSKRTCQRVLADFRAKGYIVEMRPATNVTPAIYRLDLKKIPLQDVYEKPVRYDRQTPPRGDRAPRVGVTETPSRGDTADTLTLNPQSKNLSPTPHGGDGGDLPFDLPKNSILATTVDGWLKEFDDQFWPSFPKRDGAQPKKPAWQAFLRARKRGHWLEDILRGLARDVKHWEAAGKIGTRFIPHASTWLNEEAWVGKEGSGHVDAAPSSAPAIMLYGATLPLPKLNPFEKSKLNYRDVHRIADQVFGRKSTMVEWCAVRDALGLRQNILSD